MLTCPSCSSQCEQSHKFCPACGFPLDRLQASTVDPLVGKTLAGGFVILELIGVGGMGRVYRGEQRALGRTVAIKVVHAHLANDENASARFITEARTASRLNHPNSVGIIDFGRTEDGQLYLVMEFLRGRDLARVIYEDGLPSYDRTIDILSQVLAALGDAHAMGIIHRDVKPENIVLEPTRGGREHVKVVDFGLAKVVAEQADRSLTLPGIVCGTPDYMAPEQGRGEAIDGRTDLYAVGVILYLLLAGKLPFEDTSPTQVVIKHMTVPPVDPRVVAPERNVPNSLAEVCLRALSKKPADRYENADSFAAALQACLGTKSGQPARLETSPCPACGAQNPRSQKFCGECGSKLPTSSGSDIVQTRTGVPPARGTTGPLVSLPLPFVEREDDISWLESRRGALGTHVCGARIVGEDGVGKTRLLAEFANHRQDAGEVVVRVSPDPWWASVTLWSLRNVIAELAKLPLGGGSHGDWMGAGMEARKGLTELFGISSGAPLSPEAFRYVISEALRWALVRATQLANGRTVIVMLDDLHRVDGASRNAFSDAVSEPPLAPVLVVAAHVPGFEPGWGAMTPARVIEGISHGTVSGWVGEADGPPPSSERHRGVLPMYADQAVRALREHLLEPPLPGSLADLLILRLERLSRDSRVLLQALSVLGDGADYSDLDTLLKLGSALDLSIEELLAAGLVDISETGLRFEHPMIREVVHATIPASARREFHEGALRIAQERGQPLEVQALHAHGSEDSFEALLLLEQVAVRATSYGDDEGAIHALSLALDLARREFVRGELDDPPRAVFIFSCKLADVLARTGNFTDADGVLREALDHVGTSGEDRARVLRELAKVARGRLRNTEAMEFLREAVTVARRAGADELLRSLETMQRELLSA